jgi:ABC-type transporter Mla MlaB component
MATLRPQTVAFTIRGPIARADLPGLCDRVRGLLAERPASVLLCDVCGVEPDAVAIDALARLQLAARSYGCEIRICHASDELLELVEFMGLGNVLPCNADGTMSSRRGTGLQRRRGRRKEMGDGKR